MTLASGEVDDELVGDTDAVAVAVAVDVDVGVGLADWDFAGSNLHFFKRQKDLYLRQK